MWHPTEAIAAVQVQNQENQGHRVVHLLELSHRLTRSHPLVPVQRQIRVRARQARPDMRSRQGNPAGEMKSAIGLVVSYLASYSEPAFVPIKSLEWVGGV